MIHKTFSSFTIFIVILFIISLTFVSSQRWDGNVLYDLEGSGTDFKALANLWTISSLKDSTKRVYRCDGIDVLGGYNIMGGTDNQYLQRQYDGVPAHNQIRLSFTFWPLDSWDVNDNDHINVRIGNTEVAGWAMDFKVRASPTCGNTGYDDLPSFQMNFQVAHQGADGSSITIRITNMCNEPSDNESTGIRDVKLTFETVASPSQKLCGSSTDSALPSDYTVCSCSSSEYMIPAGSGSCYGCDGSCKSCSGPNSNQCLSCVKGKYLAGSSSKTCADCHSSCATCNGPLATNCLTCRSGDFFVGGQCVPYCNEPFYTQVVGANTVCKTPCPGQFVWKGNTCTDTCPSPPYTSVIPVASLKACVCFNVVAPGQDCFTCDSSCETCDGQQASQCLTCFDRFYLAVVDDDDDVDGTCESCDSSCLTCSGPGSAECLSCDPGLFLVGGECSSCDPSCYTCDGPSSNECLSCDSHFYLETDNSCNSCDISCGDCSGPSYNQCKTCPTGDYLYNNNTCIENCDIPFFITQDDTNKYCDTPCFGSFATEGGNCVSACDTLSQSYTLYNLKACYCNTPNFRYWNNSCLSACDSPLQSTTVGVYQQCTCPNYLYKNNTCIPSCESQFFVTQDASNKYCDTNCPGKFMTNDGTCSSVCDGQGVRYELYGLKSCDCNRPNYRYWNGSCLSICDFPLKSRISGLLNYCDFPCAQSEYLFPDQSCSTICPLPHVPWGVAGNLYCRDLGCKGMKINFVKSTVTGFQYNLKLTPNSCDLPGYYINDMLNENPDAKDLLKDFHFDVTKTGTAAYFLDLTLGASVLEDTTLNLNFTGLSGKLIVFSKFKAGSFVQQLAKMADSASSGVSFVTAVTVVSVIVFKSASSIWGFVGFQQLMNYYKYINIQYPFQIEMLFKLGGATDFGALPNLLDMATNSTYKSLSKNEDLMTRLDPPQKFVEYEEDSFFIKAGGSLFLLNILLLVLLIVCHMIKKTKVGQHKHFLKVDGMLRWNFTLRSFLAASLPFLVAIFLQMRISGFHEGYVSMSTALAVFAVVYCVLISLFMVHILKRKSVKELKAEDFEKTYGTLVDKLNIEKDSGKYYYLIVFVRNILIAFMIVFVEKVPLLQILSLAFFNIGFAYYIKKFVRFEEPKETRKTFITEAMLVPMDLLICLLTKKPASEKYYEVCGWIISGVIAVIFVNEMYFVIIMQIETFKKLYKKFKPKFDAWRAKRKLKKNKIVDEKEQLSAQALHEQDQEQLSGCEKEQEPFSASGMALDQKIQSLTGELATPSPTRRAHSPLKIHSRKIFPMSNADANSPLASTGLFGEQSEKVFRRRKPHRISGFESDAKYDSFGGTPTHISQSDTPTTAMIPIIGGVESAFYHAANKPSSPINSINLANNQAEEKNELLEF